MAGKGGARAGCGQKKNAHRIHVSELRKAIEERIGRPYVEMLADSQLKLFNDFMNNENVKEYVRFTETISRKLIEEPVVELSIAQPLEDLSDDEIQGRIDNLLTRQALSVAYEEANVIIPTVDTVAAVKVKNGTPEED
jgi:hypothetical protein